MIAFIAVLFGGWRNNNGNFNNMGTNASFWSSTPNNNENAWNLYVNNNNSNANLNNNNRECGFSVRCFRDIIICKTKQ